MPDPLVLAEEFSYTYPELDHPALGDITLEIEAGSFVLLAGESGSGKSSLLRAVAGLVPHFYGGTASGDLRVDGMSVRESGPGELARVCGSVFQDPETQVVMSGVRAEIGLTLEHRGEPPEAVGRAVEETALALGIEGLLDRRTETLSGGELQRVALAGALAHRPRLLLLDEPTAQLDPVAGDELIWLLRRLNEEWGTTILLAEHRLERCLGAADRVLALETGRIVCDGAPPEFLRWAVDGGRESFVTPLARMFALAGAEPLPTSVKQARAALDPAAIGGPASAQAATTVARRARRWRRSAGSPAAALSVRGLWCELDEGPVVLRSIELELEPGERVALMGRNGAGKSTLLRHINGLVSPTRGTVQTDGRVALLMQTPGDYLVRERAGDEVDERALVEAGLAGRADANPADLSGGERQRLALEIVLAGSVPAVTLLDEPTRGMDARRKRLLGERLQRLAERGSAVLVATHDTAFAADFADRVVLMGQAIVIADGPAGSVLGGGWHFAPEVARCLGGRGEALTPEAGAPILERLLVGRSLAPG